MPAHSPLLSPREQEVVNYVAEGYSNRQIAKRLKLSEHTIRNYIFRIFDKLGLSSRVELLLYVFSQREEAATPREEGKSDEKSTRSFPNTDR